MLLKTDFLDINYTQKDESYIHEIVPILNDISWEIITFFSINPMRVSVRLWDDLKDFRMYFYSLFNYECNDWTCGFAHYDNNNYYIETLSLDSYRKTKYHENHTVDDLIYLIMHEFVHSSHQVLTKNILYPWLKEGAACFLSHQYDNKKINEFNIDLKSLIEGRCNYNYYYLLFKYVYLKYGREYIISLFLDNDLLVKDTSRLYVEAKKYYKVKN